MSQEKIKMASQKERQGSVLSDEVIKEVTFRVHRFSPDDGNPPRMQEYTIPLRKGMTVLDCLHYIRDNIDSTLSYRFSCRMGVCGSCGMFINGLPRLACQTQVLDLESDVIEVKPIPNYEVTKDLVPNLGPLFEKHRSVSPFIKGDETEIDNPTNEFLQSAEELEAFLQFTYCIKCGLCLGACPTVATDPNYKGPQALTQAYRYNTDTRDVGWKERMEMVSGEDGPWRCHFAGACSEACPKGVDPAFAIQLLKGQITFAKLGIRKPDKRAKIAPKEYKAERRPDVPNAPKPTVGSR